MTLPPLIKRVEFELRLVSEANQREHHMVTHRRKVKQQTVTHIELVAAFHKFPKQCVRKPLLIELTRIGPRFMDQDNNVGSFKHVQDAVAGFFGFDDGDRKAVRWKYGQAVGKPSRVRVEIRGRVTGAALSEVADAR